MRRRVLLRLAPFVLVFVAAAGLLVRLGHQEEGGPAHEAMVVGHGIPATLYVPGEVRDRDAQRLPDPPPPGRRPPVVVLAHGFSSDRAAMSSLARRLTGAGYAVVAFDFRGHGESRHRFDGGAPNRSALLQRDVTEVLDWVETSAQVDPGRIVLMGHSMGATTVLDVAVDDPRPRAVVAISGGRTVDGSRRPPDVLFLIAQGDDRALHRRVEHLASRLAGVARAEVDHTYGDVPGHTGVRWAEVEGRNHTTILWSGDAVREAVRWMDGALAIRRTAPLHTGDGRFGTVGLYALCALVLMAGIGLLAGRRAPATRPEPARGAGGGLLLLAAALAATTPFLALGPPASFVSLAGGDLGISHLALAGLLLLVVRAAARAAGPRSLVPAGWVAADRPVGNELRAALPVAAAVAAALYALLVPVGAVFHHLALTPERLVAMVVAALLFLPFTLAFETVVRRGRPLAAAGLALAGRALVFAVLLAGLLLGMVPGFADVYVPVLTVLFLLVEVFAIPAYAVGGSVALIALVEALFVAWIMAATMPIG